MPQFRLSGGLADTASTTAYEKNLANNAASAVVRVNRASQTAPALPKSPRRILSGKTDQGQRLTTRVRCTPVKASVAGEVSYCKVTKAKGVVRVKVFGTSRMKVKVVQTARGNAMLRPFVQRKTYLVKP